MQFKQNIKEIAHNYDYFIIDLWGVIHDGLKTYPEAIERLEYLKSLNKRVCFLSNAPRRAKKAAQVLENLGIGPHLYEFIMTSGEATYLSLKDNKINIKINNKYFYIGPDKDADLLHGLNYEPVQNAKNASFVIATGFSDENSTIDERISQLIEAKKYDLPMICVNPDLIVVRQNGNKMICAGILANKYKEIGGKVIYFGKPYKLVYDLVFDLFSTLDRSKVLAIGDGIETDILGANKNNIDSAFIPGGILGQEIGVKHGELPDESSMKQTCQKYQVNPKFIISNL